MKPLLRTLLLVATAFPLAASALPELAVSAPEGPERLFSGRTAEVTFMIDNVGDQPANGFEYKAYVSNNRVIVRRDPELQIQAALVTPTCELPTCAASRPCAAGSTCDPTFGRCVPDAPAQPAPGGPLDLAAGATVCVRALGMVPETLVDGEYFYGVIVDPTGAVEESNPSNNSQPSLESVPLRAPAPDLTVSEVRLPAKGAAGESLPVTFTLENRGNLPADFSYGVYLSQNEIVSARDVLLGQETHHMEGGVQETPTKYVVLAAGLAEGSYYVGVVVDAQDEIAELDEFNNARVSAVPVEVTRPALSLRTSFVPEAILGGAYVWRFAAQGGTGAYNFSIIDGDLPPGLSLDGDLGEVSGIPTDSGEYTFVLQVRSGEIAVASAYTLLVVRPTVSLTIQSASLPPAVLADDYRTRLAAVGGIAPYTWTVPEEDLPEGMTLDAEGVLTGSARAPGLFELNLQVRDARGTVARRLMELRVIDRGGLTITTGFLPPGEAGAAYIAGFETTNGKAPITWALVGGRLPTGLALDAMDAILQGTPTEVGRFTFQVQARDANGLFDTNSYTVDVVSQPLAIVTNELANAAVGVAYAQPLNVLSTSGEAPFIWSLASGSLPAGLTFSEEGHIGGEPEEGTAGLYTLLIRAVDQRGAVGHRSFLLQVDDPALKDRNSIQPEPEGGCSATGGGAGSFALLLVAGALALLRRRRGALLAAVALLVPSAAEAQATYTVMQSTETFTEVSGGTRVSFTSTDSGKANVNLPFPVRFYDQSFNTIGVTTDGIIVMGLAGSYYSSNDTIPDAGTPNGFVAAWWDDLKESTTGTVTTKTLGSAPRRVFVVQYLDYQRWGGSQKFDFQVRFYENQSTIKVNYGPITTGSDTMNATVGIENPSGTTGVVGLACNGNCASSAWPAGQALTYTTLPDLIAHDATAPSLVYGGVPVQVSGAVENIGGEPAGPFSVVAVLSEDRVHDAGDTLLEGSAQVPGLGLGAAAQISFVTTIPATVTPEQTYYLFLVPNRSGQLTEVGLENNPSNAVPIQTGPPTPNFKAAAPQTATSTVAPGGNLSVTFNIHNTGNLGGQTEYRIVLSRNAVISREDLVLLSGSVNVAAQAVETFTTTVPIGEGVASGAYYLGLLVDPDDAVTEPNEADNAAASQALLAVASGEVVLLSPTLPAGIVGRPYLAYLQAGGGDGTYTWNLATGELPPGLVLDRSGIISGIPEAAGEFRTQIMLRSGGGILLPNFSLTVTDPSEPLTVVSAQLPDAVFGAEYVSQLIAAGGLPPYQWEVASGQLPAGLFLAANGQLAGLARGDGEYALTVSVSDEAGSVSEQGLSLFVAQPGNVVVVTMNLPPARLGESYDLQLQAAGGQPPYRWSIVAPGRLPGGLVLSEDGRITGAPEEVGSFDVLVQVRDHAYKTDTNTLSLSVGYDQGITITTEHLPPATLGVPYEATLRAVGGTSPYSWFIVGGGLPAGLNLGEDGVISGTASGSEEDTVQVITVEAIDAAGRRDLRGLSLFVGPRPATPVIEGEGCSTASGSGGAFGLLLVLGAALIGARRRPRFRPITLASGVLGVALGLGLAGACGPSNPCSDVECAAGSVCSVGDGLCHCGGPGGEVCSEDQACDPHAFVCREASDLCSAVECTHGMHCDAATGECACGAQVCTGDQVCDLSAGRCLERNRCDAVMCAPGEQCNEASGLCECGGVACTIGETCVEGACVADPCYGIACAGGTMCDPTDGACKCGGEGGMECTAAQVCDPDRSACIAAASCVGVTCRVGFSCDPSDGVCKCGGLGGETCRDDQVCDLDTFQCTGGDACFGVTCTGGTQCDPEDGMCKCGGLDGSICATGELCVTIEGLGGFCTPPCTPAYDTTGCPEDMGCYYSPDVDQTYCYQEGPQPTDSFCSTTDDCASGHHCIQSGGAFPRCMPYCDPSSMPPADGSCESGLECDATLFREEPSLGVCIVFE